MNNNEITTNNTNETINHNNVNLSCFIIPNTGLRLDQLLKSTMKQRIRQLGINVDDKDPVYQVWLCCPEEHLDNVSCHGYSDRQCKLLGLNNQEEESEEWYRCFAPSYLPQSLLLSVKEGETRSFTAPTGCTVNITFEQLPYRYRSFGPIEQVARRLVPVTAREIVWQDEMREKINKKS